MDRDGPCCSACRRGALPRPKWMAKRARSLEGSPPALSKASVSGKGNGISDPHESKRKCEFPQCLPARKSQRVAGLRSCMLVEAPRPRRVQELDPVVGAPPRAQFQDVACFKFAENPWFFRFNSVFNSPANLCGGESFVCYTVFNHGELGMTCHDFRAYRVLACPNHPVAAH
jgi:hypothetical protein